MKRISGKIYKYSYDSSKFITKYESHGNVRSINLKNNSLENNNFGWSGTLEEASLNEIAWYEQCITENKFIPFDQIKFNEELEIEIW